MSDFITFTAFGLSVGAIYAIAASGLVVTYTTSGIFNFAHGAVAMFAAFVYYQVRFDEVFGVTLPAPLALVLVIGVLAPIGGAVIERVFIRGLQGTSEITQMVVPIALLLMLTGLANWIWPADRPRIPEPFFGATRTVKLGDAAITYHQIITFVVAILLAGGLRLLLYNTRLGVTMRAVVDNPDLTMLNGGRPHRASAASWAIGFMLAALAGILITAQQQTSLSPFPLTLLVVNAYAAAIFGRLRNLPLTFVGGLVIGLAVSYWNWFSETGSKWPWLSQFRLAIPVLILFVVLVMVPSERLRGAIARAREHFRMPTMRQAVIWGGALVGVYALAIPIVEPTVENLLATGMAFSIIALSLVLLTGYAGEVNLAPLTFAGIGAMVAYQVDVGPYRQATQEHLSVWALVMAAVVCAIVGGIVALPALRLRGLYLGLVTFSFGVAVQFMVFKQIDPLRFNIPFVGDREDIEINLFSNGTFRVPKPHFFGVDFGASQGNYLILLTAVFAVLGILLVALRRSAFGRQLAAMKDSPAACATLGLNLVRLKLSVFMLSSAIAGVGGALYAAQVGGVNEDNFNIFASLPLFMLTVVGGIGYVAGALIGGFFNGVMFLLMSNTWDKLAVDYAAFEGLFNWMGDLFAFVGPAFVTLGLARAPSGIASQFIEGYEFMGKRRGRPFVAAWIALQALLYLVRLADGIGNWTFVLLSMGLGVLMPALAMALRPDLVHTPEELAARRRVTPPEWVGIDRPYGPNDRHDLDTELGIADFVPANGSSLLAVGPATSEGGG